jgi:hypothetical protein
MKPTLFILTFIFAINSNFAQNFQELADTKFSTTEDYKTSETNVLNCADYLLSTAYNKEDLNRVNAMQFIMNWMEGTPDYTFNIDKKVTTLTEGNDTLLSLYLAGISKVVIEQKEASLTPDQLYSKTEQLLVDYCANRRNNVKPSVQIKQLIKAKKG